MSALAARTGRSTSGRAFRTRTVPPRCSRPPAGHHAGLNQYPPGHGMPGLLEAIAEHQRRFYGIDARPRPRGARHGRRDRGPRRDAPRPRRRRRRGRHPRALLRRVWRPDRPRGRRHVTVPLRAPDFRLDHDELRAAFSDRTRAHPRQQPEQPDRDGLAARDPRTHRRARPRARRDHRHRRGLRAPALRRRPARSGRDACRARGNAP